MKLLVIVLFLYSDSLLVDSLHKVQNDTSGAAQDTLITKIASPEIKPGKSVQELIKLADESFHQIDYELADSLYLQALALDSTNAELHWRLSRLYVCIGDGINPEYKDQRAPFYDAAIRYAKKSIELNDKNAKGYTWLAAALGVSADISSSKERIKKANEIKDALDNALALNPNEDIAYSILGSFYHAISNIGWLERFFANTFLGSVPDGSFEQSEAAYQKAISIDSTIIRHYYEFALLYMDWDKPEKALALLKTARDLPVKMKNDRRRKREIKEMIAELEKKISHE